MVRKRQIVDDGDEKKRGRNVVGMLKMLREARGGREELGEWMKEMSIWVVVEKKVEGVMQTDSEV